MTENELVEIFSNWFRNEAEVCVVSTKGKSNWTFNNFESFAKAILKKLEEERRDSREKIIEVLKKYITIEPISKVSNPGLILYKQIADEILSIEKLQHKCI